MKHHKNKKFIDPRYFMDEKVDDEATTSNQLDEASWRDKFKGAMAGWKGAGEEKAAAPGDADDDAPFAHTKPSAAMGTTTDLETGGEEHGLDPHDKAEKLHNWFLDTRLLALSLATLLPNDAKYVKQVKKAEGLNLMKYVGYAMHDGLVAGPNASRWSAAFEQLALSVLAEKDKIKVAAETAVSDLGRDPKTASSLVHEREDLSGRVFQTTQSVMSYDEPTKQAYDNKRTGRSLAKLLVGPYGFLVKLGNGIGKYLDHFREDADKSLVTALENFKRANEVVMKQIASQAGVTAGEGEA